MARNSAPFERGSTFHAGETAPTASADWNPAHQGQVRVFPNIDPNNRRVRRDGGDVICIAVRNNSGIALLPKRLVTWESGQRGQRVNGYAITTAQSCAGVVDEFLPAAGCPDDDLFWLTIKGQTLIKTALEGDDTNLISADGVLVSTTAAASTGLTSGRLAPQTLTGATEPLAIQIQNRIGRALSSNTTGQTDRDLLCEVDFFL